MINYKNNFFPNITFDIRSGFFAFDQLKFKNNLLKTDQMYWFFNSNLVTLYDFNLHKPIKTQSLEQFLKCNQTLNNK